MSQNHYGIFASQYFVDLCLYQYGDEQKESLGSYGPFIRNHFLFHYVISGKGELQAQDSAGVNHNYQIHAGEGFMIFPGQITTYYADKDDPWAYTWVEFDGLRANEAVLLTGLSREHPVYHSTDPRLSSELKEMIYHLALTKEQTTFYQVGQMYRIIDALIRSSSRHKQASAGKMSDFYVKEALTFIDSHYKNDITVEDIAAFCNVSRSYLSKLFVRSVGKGPQEFLISYRMDKAAMLLEQTSMSIGVISEEVGYPNQLHFSRAFKKVFGESPRIWRNNHARRL